MEDTGQPGSELAPVLYLRVNWSLRRRITKYAENQGLTNPAAVKVLLDEALTRKGIL